ncbi:putative receptor-like protein kinase [Forsythia ovata]|uniref:non-specific serine/threonine protein kinase n=1 Tax=Forsythia ovata TaxID=205694 RepID=A0ABD1QS58_9LAMI
MPSRQPFLSNPSPKISITLLPITVSASLITLFAIIYFIYYLWYSLVHRSRTSPFDSSTALNKLQRFSYNELKNATHNFSDSNSIGKGGSGTVFIGILKNGKLVAVKLLNSTSFQCEQQFQNELKMLSGLKSCPFIVSLLGYCVEKSRRLLVYEYMPNKSLQESLFSESNNGNSDHNLCLNWDRRLNIILDVAKALAFLHIELDPPVIHGDVKPSNVLLDSEFRAKLSDFGLAKLKLEGDLGVDLYSQDLGKSQELFGNSIRGGGGEIETPAIGTPVESHENDEVDFALALQASCSSKNSCKIYHNVKGLALNSLHCDGNPGDENDNKDTDAKGKEASTNENGGEDWNKFVNYDEDLSSMDHGKGLKLNAAFVGDVGNSNTTGGQQWGKDWWWRQDRSDEWCSRDYVMEWIGSQICPSANPRWKEETKCSRENINMDNSTQLDKFEEVNETPLRENGFECPNGAVGKQEPKRSKVHTKKHRKMQEWWKEEHLDELSKKSTKKVKKLEIRSKKRFKLRYFGMGKRWRRKFGHENENVDDPDTEFSFRKGWKKKNSPSIGSDMWSGDIFSRELSSTTSMRGTLCYVAPEYSACGYLMEKADIYSLGVLILVVVSGRRPLHVLSSPMNLEKANLISWCRHLAYAGNILELVDEKLKDDYNKDEVTLCINLALACLQKMPELRPDIGDIVKVLKGEMELPALPFEFSPSPPKFFSKSRRKHKNNED